MAIPCIGRMSGGSLVSKYAFRQYRGVHHRGRHLLRDVLRQVLHRRRRLPSHPGWARLPPHELRALPRGCGDLRAPLLHAGPPPARLHGLRGQRERGELDGVRGDGCAGAVRPPHERAVGAVRTAYVDDGVAGGRGDGRTPGPLRPVDRRAGRAAGGAGRGAGGPSGLRDGLSGGGGPPQGPDHGDRPLRGGQQRRRHERPGHHRLGRAGVGMAGRRRRDRDHRGGLRGRLPYAPARAEALHARLAAAAGAGPYGP